MTTKYAVVNSDTNRIENVVSNETPEFESLSGLVALSDTQHQLIWDSGVFADWVIVDGQIMFDRLPAPDPVQNTATSSSGNIVVEIL